MTDWQTESIQLDNLFKQPQVLLLFAELQLDVGRNNSVLSVTCSHRTVQSLGLDGSSEIVQSNLLLRAGCSGSCPVRSEYLQG